MDKTYFSLDKACFSLDKTFFSLEKTLFSLDKTFFSLEKTFTKHSFHWKKPSQNILFTGKNLHKTFFSLEKTLFSLDKTYFSLGETLLSIGSIITLKSMMVERNKNHTKEETSQFCILFISKYMEKESQFIMIEMTKYGYPGVDCQKMLTNLVKGPGSSQDYRSI